MTLEDWYKILEQDPGNFETRSLLRDWAFDHDVEWCVVAQEFFLKSRVHPVRGFKDGCQDEFFLGYKSNSWIESTLNSNYKPINDEEANCRTYLPCLLDDNVARECNVIPWLRLNNLLEVEEQFAHSLVKSKAKGLQVV